jgi:hypothetical protein
MTWQDVQSSTLQQVAYDEAAGALCVRFKSRGLRASYYRYRNVSPELFAALVAAQSKGKFFAEQVKRFPQRHPFERVDEQPGFIQRSGRQHGDG